MVILAAVDENERSKQVVSIAYDIADTYDDRLVALHVVPTDDYETHKQSLQEIPEFQDFSITQEADSAKRFVREFVSNVVEDLDPTVLEPRGRVGVISEEILAETADLDPRFLVIGGRRRSPVGKAVFGNTAQRILLNARCPVVSKLTDD